MPYSLLQHSAIFELDSFICAQPCNSYSLTRYFIEQVKQRFLAGTFEKTSKAQVVSRTVLRVVDGYSHLGCVASEYKAFMGCIVFRLKNPMKYAQIFLVILHQGNWNCCTVIKIWDEAG